MYRRRKPFAISRTVHPLVVKFIDSLNSTDMPWQALAKRSGISVNTMKQWKYRSMPSLDLFDAALNVLGLELAIVPKGTREKQHGVST